MADEHPLPWRWGVGPEEVLSERPNLLDADGKHLIWRVDGCNVTTRYVAAVTERAGAMELLLRAWAAETEGYLTPRAKEMAATSPGWARVVQAAESTKALLAEIDSANGSVVAK